MRQTAVEWLVEQLIPSIALQQNYIDELKEKAKGLEKQQITDAYICGRFEEDKINRDDRFYARQYYKKIFQKKFAQEKKKL